MKSNIELIENPLSKITLTSPRASIFCRIILQFFTVFFFILPILSTIGTMLLIGELSFGFVFFYIMFGLSGYYFLRLFLWNKYGKELIYLEKEKIIYEADYKFFKDNKTEIDTKTLAVEIKQHNVSNEIFGTLLLKDEDQFIDTIVQIPLLEIESLKIKIEELYNLPA